MFDEEAFYDQLLTENDAELSLITVYVECCVP